MGQGRGRGLAAHRGRHGLAALLCALALGGATPSGAGDPVATPAAPTLPPSQREFERALQRWFPEGEAPLARWWRGPYATGDWGGWRGELDTAGVALGLTYTTDILGNPIGGRRHKVRYFHNIGLDVLLDLDALVGLRGAHIHLSAASRAGKSLSDEDIGNYFNVAQTCCGPDTEIVTVAWEQQLFDGRLGIRAGQLSAGDDFFTSPLYWQFVTSGIDGNPGALFYNVPFTAYPDSTLGLRLRGRPLPGLTLQAGVYNGDVTTTSRGLNTNFGDHFGNGALLLAEVGYRLALGTGPDRMPGHVRLGGYYHTGRFRRLDAPAGSDLPRDVVHGAGGIYAHADQMLVRFADAADPRGVVPFVAVLGAPDADVSLFPFFLESGVVVRGPLVARPLDDVVVGFAYGAVSGALRDAERAAGEPLQEFEMVFEWSYIVQVTPWLQVQPDVQYVLRPGGTGGIPDALVLGTQLAVSF